MSVQYIIGLFSVSFGYNMDLRHLKYFVAVAEELHFTRAAERLHIAQPPLSKQIRQLEEEIGVTLLHRTKRHIELTDAGRLFLDRARKILESTKLAVVQAQHAQRGEIGRLVVGFFEYTSYTFLPPILHAYRERFPAVDVELRWFPMVEQADALRRGEVDVSFLRKISDLEGVFNETIYKEPFVLAIPDAHPLARFDSISLKDCANENFISYFPKSAPDFHSMITRMCAAAGFIPRIASEVMQVHTAVGLVNSGAGIAFVPSAVQKVHFDKVQYRPIKGKTPRIELKLGWTQTTPSPLVSAFLDTAKRVLKTSQVQP